MIAAVIVFAGGVVLAIAQPGDLGGKTSTSQGARKTTTTTSTTLSNASTSVSSAASTSSSSASPTTAPATTTTTPKTTTTTAGGLGQSGAGGTGTGQHPVTGGTSMLWLGALLAAVAFALRRSLSGATARA